MLSKSFFDSKLMPPISDVIIIDPEETAVSAIKAAALSAVDYLLLKEGEEISGVIPIRSLLTQVDRLSQLKLIDFAEKDFIRVKQSHLSHLCRRKTGSKYLLITPDEDSAQISGIVDLAIFSKRDQHILDNSLELVDAILNSSHNGIIALDHKKRVVAINDSALEIYGITDENVVDMPLSTVMPGSPLNDFIIQENSQIHQKYDFDGKTIVANRTPLKMHDQVVGVISVFQDITVSEEIFRELLSTRQNEKNLESIIEASYDGIYITDKDGLTLRVNKAYQRLTGVSEQDIVGRYMKDLRDDGVVSIYVTDEVVRQKKPVTINQTVNKKKNLVITGSPIFDSKGEVERVITNVRDITELVNLQKELLVSKIASNLYQEELFRDFSSKNIVCQSASFKNVLKLSQKVSSKDSTVLILGETGVGKEVIARYIHMNSKRSSDNYIKINCGAIPANLLESELFGYAPGAFTNANPKGKVGLFELAHNGTLFLDEIGEMPMDLQSSLLRVLQDGEVTRVGDTKSKKVNVRIIAATNRNLEEMILAGTFRNDLYYRLNVVSVTIPPLRERLDDIPGLAEHFIAKLNEKYGENKIITSSFIDRLMMMNWPGNVREMGNFIEKQFVMSDEDIMDSFTSASLSGKATDSRNDPKVIVEGILPLGDAVHQVESTLIKRAMEKAHTTYKAAKLLEISQPTFFRKYKEYCKDEVTDHEE